MTLVPVWVALVSGFIGAVASFLGLFLSHLLESHRAILKLEVEAEFKRRDVANRILERQREALAEKSEKENEIGYKQLAIITFCSAQDAIDGWTETVARLRKLFDENPVMFTEPANRAVFADFVARPVEFNEERAKLLREALATLTVPTIDKILLEERVFTATPKRDSSPTPPIKPRWVLRRLVSRLTSK